MRSTSSRLLQSRRTIYAALGLAVLSAAALIVTTSAVGGATDAVVEAASNNVTVSATGNQGATPQLGDIEVPDAPATCGAAQLSDRQAQLRLLEQEQAAELRVIATITDGSLNDKLKAIRDRAQIILGRIDQIHGRCPAGGGGAPAPAPAPADPVDEQPDVEEPAEPAEPADPPAEQPPAGGGDGADRVLAALDITCADVDLSSVDPAAAARAEEELARNEAQLDGRLASDFPRFSARVAREADPTRAAAEFRQLAENLANTLEDRRVAILERARLADARAAAETCEVVEVA
jgi:hypothetical protein